MMLMAHKLQEHAKLSRCPDTMMKGVGWTLNSPGILDGGKTPHSGAPECRAVPEGQLQEVRTQFVPH